jgi:hypothetical protein
LALATGALVIAEALAGALNFKECPALSIGANSNVTRLKELSSDYAIQQRSNSEADVRVHFWRVWESKRREHVYKFADHNSCIKLRGQERVAP